MHGPRTPGIVGVGIACLDYLFLAPWAEVGGHAQLEAHLIQGGGLIGTGLVAAARLGAQTEIWTWVGDDDRGRQIVSGLADEGVDVGHVEVIAGVRQPVSFVHVQAGRGERTIYHGPRLEVPPRMIAALSDRPLSCDVLLVDSVWPDASVIAARRARAAGIPVVGDLYPYPGLAELAREVTALAVPAGAADRSMPDLSREAQLHHLASMCSGTAAITCGSEGCYYLDAGVVKHQPAFPVEVVDTTGAGDVFHGALAYAVGRRWTIAQSIEFASAAGALSCRALGGRTAAPTLNEVLTLLKAKGSAVWRDMLTG
jgi:sulfofructose kinase